MGDDKQNRSNFIRKIADQFTRFAIIGLIAFGIDYSLLIILTELADMMYLLSSAISFTASVIFNYIGSMRFVFRHRDDISRVREFVTFILLSICGLALNTFFLWIGTGLLGIDYRISKIFVTGFVTIFNFITRRIFLDGDREAAKKAEEAQLAKEQTLEAQQTEENQAQLQETEEKASEAQQIDEQQSQPQKVEEPLSEEALVEHRS